MTTTPAPLDLDELKALLDDASPAPWVQETEGSDIIKCPLYTVAETIDSSHDAAFIAAARNALPALLTTLDEIDRARDTAEFEQDQMRMERDAARKELAKVRTELDGRIAWLYRNSTRMTQMRYNAATAAGYDFTQYTAVMEQPADRDALIAYLREEITLAEREIALIEANPATMAEPADEPKATCHLPVQNGEPCGLVICRKNGCRVAPDATPAQVRP